MNCGFRDNSYYFDRSFEINEKNKLTTRTKMII